MQKWREVTGELDFVRNDFVVGVNAPRSIFSRSFNAASLSEEERRNLLKASTPEFEAWENESLSEVRKLKE
jgi:hypothetical protein